MIKRIATAFVMFSILTGCGDPDLKIQDGDSALLIDVKNELAGYVKNDVGEMSAMLGKNTMLINAAGKGDRAAVDLLILKGADPNAVINGKTAMIEGANYPLTLERLITAGADVNKIAGETYPLSAAAGAGKLDSVKCLIKHGAVSRPNSMDHLSPLVCAIHSGNVDIVRTLIDRGDVITAENGLGAPICSAALFGSIPIVKLLLEKGAGVNDRGSNAYSPLGEAVRGGHTDLVTFLLKRGADYNSLEYGKYSTPLSLALEKKEFEIAKTLKNHGAEINSSKARSLVDDALKENCPECLRGLFAVAPQYRKKYSSRIRQAARDEYTDIVKILAPAADNSQRGSALCYAGYKGNTKMAEMLIRNKPVMNKKYEIFTGKYGQRVNYTPLDAAIMGGNPDIVSMFLQHGAKFGSSFRYLCWCCGKDKELELVKLLVENGVDPTKSVWACRPLHTFIKKGQIESVEYLLKHGADPKLLDDKKRSPMDIARKRRDSAIINLLREYGAEY
jgi:ankyrin repeat protein